MLESGDRGMTSIKNSIQMRITMSNKIQDIRVKSKRWQEKKRGNDHLVTNSSVHFNSILVHSFIHPSIYPFVVITFPFLKCITLNMGIV
uniref:Uncharacterized protein n=1 Tax=Onchocerca volvulus TaxID=6282 RepID=A0A8R1TNQ2_ONCVO